MGLPGAGKTTLADALAKKIKSKRLNADEVRKEANDWDFSEEGRKRQAKRMSDFALKLKSNIHSLKIPSGTTKQDLAVSLLVISGCGLNEPIQVILLLIFFNSPSSFFLFYSICFLFFS